MVKQWDKKNGGRKNLRTRKIIIKKGICDAPACRERTLWGRTLSNRPCWHSSAGESYGLRKMNVECEFCMCLSCLVPPLPGQAAPAAGGSGVGAQPPPEGKWIISFRIFPWSWKYFDLFYVLFRILDFQKYSKTLHSWKVSIIENILNHIVNVLTFPWKYCLIVKTFFRHYICIATNKQKFGKKLIFFSTIKIIFTKVFK